LYCPVLNVIFRWLLGEDDEKGNPLNVEHKTQGSMKYLIKGMAGPPNSLSKRWCGLFF